jgi:Sodium/hydrogen exchanger family
VTTNQVLIGIGLILVLAVGSQVLASRLKIPAIIVLLPAGFTAGAITTDVNPQLLLGAAFQPLVSLAVAVILYDAGLSLDLRKLRGHGVVAPYTGGEVLFDPRLTRYEVGRQYAAGARIRTRPANGTAPADDSLLFLVRADGRLAPVTANGPPRSEPGDTMVLFCPAAEGP